MRRTALLLAALVTVGLAACTSSSGGGSSPTSSAREPLPAVGAVKVYQVTRGNPGHAHTFRTVTVTAVRAVGTDVDETLTDTESGQPTVRASLQQHADGSVSEPATTTLRDGVTVTRSGLTLPSTAVLRSGRVVHETATYTLTRDGRTEHLADVVGINGDAMTTVTVPAGTFSVLPVDVIQDVGTSGDGLTIATTLDIAEGVGAVRETVVETTSGGTSTTSQEVLVTSHGVGTTLL